MALGKMLCGSSSDSSPNIMLVAVVNNQTTSERKINSDYVTVSSNGTTVTFLKKVKGYIIDTGITLSGGTATISQIISNRRAYTSNIREFEANVNDTIKFSNDFTYAGYEIVCIDA